MSENDPVVTPQLEPAMDAQSSAVEWWAEFDDGLHADVFEVDESVSG